MLGILYSLSISRRYNVAYFVLLQEAVVLPPYIALAIRPKPDVWKYVQVNTRDLSTRQLTTSEYLQLKECIVDKNGMEL